ncbi:MAG TPA: hypothetical protein DGD08_13830 [Gemmatimonas aurantiaca]|uniref:Blue (type 1) copper domain-containing protein n=2 Tax=Gemmatimonas aurantiaca TaxID=173480 RepID=C1AAB4_GEMAT|nr:hypothetical protein [Gemmatimonas aurantiaca]BAH39712.1 hypothetical protein GAU_2670 [Gemmatimonas aurantiaca T-27]HCT58278.1 hypothetical protein [Gemmatimonas aurantiaca]
MLNSLRLATASISVAVFSTSLTAQVPRTAAQAAVPRTAAVAAIPAVAGANVVSVVANDYAFDMPASIPSGLTTIRFVNKGKELHHLYLVKVEKGKKPDDVLAWFKAGGPPPAWMKPVGGPNASATETVFTSTLEAGEYVALCVIPSPGGPPHVMKGMIKALTVTPSSNKAPAPTADVTLTLSDYDFGFSKPLSPGKHVIAVKNTGKQPHEFFLAKLLPGKTPMQMAQFAEKPEGAPPGIPFGGITDILPGATVYLSVDVPVGEYALMCFTPDGKDGKPHLAHGMIKQVSVK